MDSFLTFFSAAHYLDLLLFIIGFAIIALAAERIGTLFTRAKLPLITGFLFTGIIAGPFILNLLSEETVTNLRFVDEISLAFIAFAAGSELYLREIRDRLKSIAWITAGLVIFTFSLASLDIILLADYIPFMQGLTFQGQIAVAILAGAILVARSPSAAIAIINELRAKGRFTQTVLGVTVIMDVVVIILFAINSSAADALLTGLSFNVGFIALLVADLLMALALGYLFSKLLQLILSRRLNKIIKTGLILLTGYAVFILSEQIRHITHDTLAFEVLIEPLLVCMIASFLLTNYTNHRLEFLKIIHDTGPPIYVAFFTLTGASLELDVLAKTWPIALILFAVRLVGIFMGSMVGGVIAKEPMSHNRIRWLAFITQAGVALGLAKEVAVEFPTFGDAFATTIISLVVLNEMIGPIMLKWTINKVGEARPRATAAEFDGRRDAIIFGLNGQSISLGRQLGAHGWQVKVASQKTEYTEYMDEITASDIKIQAIRDLSLKTLQLLNVERADAVVTLLSDEENYRICELVYENFGTESLVVQLNDRTNADRFHRLGALTVDPATASVSLLDHIVRSPSAAPLLLGTEERQDIVDLEVRNPNLQGLALRDVRLPLDTLVLSVHRKGQALVPHGFTRLKQGDQLTIVGSAQSLNELMLRFED